MSIVFSLLSLAVPVGLVALIVYAFRRRGPAAPGAESRGVRRFFQYLVLFALVIVAAVGASDLLGRLLGGDQAAGATDLARSLAFVLVGVPLGLLLARWTARTHRDDPGERASGMYAVYVTLAALTALVVSMFALSEALSMAFRATRYDGGPIATLAVFGLVWWAHWRLAARTLDVERGTPHLLLGSLIGLGTVLAGFVAAVAVALRLLTTTELILGSSTQLGRAAALFVTGALVWAWYWNRGAARLPRTILWLVYVLPIGVGGGLLTALVAASIALWHVLVWLVGDRFGASAAEHFDDTPTALAAAIGGLLVWWYHRAVLAAGADPGRTEVRRVYEYLVSGLGLLAAASGVGMVIVAVIESATPGLDLGVSVLNTLLGALTLLLVGVPVWWVFWSRVRRVMDADPSTEVASPTRRTYLVLLFGLAGVAAIVALIVVVFLLLRDVIGGTLSGETIRAMRYGLGVLIASAAVSAYHGAVHRQDREVAVPARVAGPRSVVLVGDASPTVERLVEQRTGARASLWRRVHGAVPWSDDDLLAALAGHTDEDLLVIADAEGVRVLVVDPSGRPSRTPERPEAPPGAVSGQPQG